MTTTTPRTAVELHTDSVDEFDAVTYEVLRNKLWNINIEHGNTILRASGGPIVVLAHDFNPAILTEDADFVFYGPYIQFLASAADMMVKWTLEHRADNPGINDGDMFLSNDPFIGCTHQQDVALLCPVFVDGKIFAWVTNSIHQTDVGGMTPGSFCPAPDIYYESTPIPPMKMVEGGQIRRDLEDVYLRRSRTPGLLALDLRAGIAGNNVARNEILKLVDRYGADVVKGVMRRIISQSQEIVAGRLERLPDGIYRDRRYVESALPGDRGVYQHVLTLRKEGRKLIVSNEGTDPQTGALNCSFGGFRSAIINALAIAFCGDLYYAIGGLIRCLEFDVVPGTLLTAEYPASVSNGPNAALMVSLGQVANATGRMLVRDPAQRDKIVTSASQNGCIVDGMSAVSDEGGYWAGINFEMVSGAIGAFAHKDGIPSGGLIFDLKGRAPEVEGLELTAPILYLYRREYADSAGAGRWARGTCVGSAFIPHGTDAVHHDPSGVGIAVPTSPGLFGGYPGGCNTLHQKLDSDIDEWLERGDVPLDLDEIQGELRRLPPKGSGIVQRPGDVHVFVASGGAGYGDPLLREPERVAEDVLLGYHSEQVANDIYGVILDDGEFDASATEKRRLAIRRERLGGSEPAVLAEREGPAFTETLIVTGEGRLGCRMCGHDLCDEYGDYKAAALRRDLPITAAGPRIEPPEEYVDVEMQFRQFVCPSCGILIDTEVARASDPVFRDVELLPRG